MLYVLILLVIVCVFNTIMVFVLSNSSSKHRHRIIDLRENRYYEKRRVERALDDISCVQRNINLLFCYLNVQKEEVASHIKLVKRPKIKIG